MRRLKRVTSLATASIVAFSSLLTMGFAPLAHATSGSDTCTWTGATDLNFSTAGNWSGCSSAAPVSGDSLVFDVTNLNSDATLNNDISNLSVGSITFQGSNSSFSTYTLTGNGITVSGGITANASSEIDFGLTLGADQTFTAGTNRLSLGDFSAPGTSTININGHTLTLAGTNDCQAVQINDKLSGSGAIMATSTYAVGLLADNSNYSGTITVSAGELFANGSTGLGDGTGQTSITGTGSLHIGASQDITINAPLTLNSTASHTIVVGDPTQLVSCSGGGGNASPLTVTLSGAVTLQQDATYYSGQPYNLNVTGTLTKNGHTLSVASGSTGNLTTVDGTFQAPASTTTINAGDNQPNTAVNIANNQTYIIDGQRGDVDVAQGGVLKGDGQVNSLSVEQGGTVAPGHSPGKLTVVSQLSLNGTYQAELKDKADGDFDQLVVGAATDTDNNNPDVTLGDSNGSPTLTVSLYDGYKIAKGDQFMIINNLSKTDVKGTFANLPEGATFKVGAAVFSITYKGGDGNDVVLTTVTAPTAPDTGFAMVASHPGATLGLSILAAGTIFVLAQRNRRISVRATRR